MRGNEEWYRPTLAVWFGLLVVASAAAGPAIAVGTTDGTGTETTNVGQSPSGGGATPTFVEENVTSDTTWTASEGPYRVIKSVTVEEGATLTIEPGTTVQVSDGVTLTVRGGLVTQGTADAPVNITAGATDPQPGAWGALRLNATTASELTLEHTRVSYATNGVTVSGGDTRVTFDGGAVLNSSETGILYSGPAHGDGDPQPFTLRGVTVNRSGENGVGIYGHNVSDVRIRDSRLHANELTAIEVGTDGWVKRITISENEFSDYERAVDIGGQQVEDIRIAGNEFRDGRDAPVVEVAAVGVDDDPSNGVVSATFEDNRIVDNGGDAVVVDGFKSTHDLTFAGNRIARSGAGIRVEFDSGDTTNDLRALAFRNNEVVNVSGPGIALSSEQEAIRNVSLSGGVVRRNDGTGISISAGGEISGISDIGMNDVVVAENDGSGVTITAESNVTGVKVTDSLIDANRGESGLLLEAERFSDARIERNRVLENRRYGVQIRSAESHADPVLVAENVIAANRYGVRTESFGSRTQPGGPSVELVRNTIAFNYHNDRDYDPREPESGNVPGDAGIRVSRASTDNTARQNDIYGNIRGAISTRGGAITAENNYWGAENGPYHESANPQGEGNPVVGSVEKVDFVPFLEERVGTHEELQKPTARFASDQARAYETREYASEAERERRAVTVSAAPSSDPDGSVESYVFWVEGDRDDRIRSPDPEASFNFEATGSFNISLVVEDDTGIDSNVTKLPVTVTEGTPTPEPTLTPSPTASPTPEPEDDEGETPTPAPEDGDTGDGEDDDAGDDGGAGGDGTDTASGSGPGFGPAVAAVALAVALLIRRW